MTTVWPVGACQVMTNMGVKGALKAAWSMPGSGSQRLLVAIARRKRRRTTTTTDDDNGNRLSQGRAASPSLTALAKRRQGHGTPNLETLKGQQTGCVEM